MASVNLTLDGKTVAVPAGSTILDAAKALDVRIPTLCFLEDQKIKANCRICLVEVEGMRTLQPACATPASEGMKVKTNTPVVMDARRNSLQLMLSHHPIDCQSCVRLENSHQEDLTDELCNYCFYCDCVKDGDCELQTLADEYGVNAVAYEWTERKDPIDSSAASFEHNPNKCILCRRCVDSCGEGQGVFVWSITGRGGETRLRPALGKQLKDSQCVECGQCVRNCPVGSLYEKQELDDILDANQNRKIEVTVRAEPYFLAEYLRVSGQADKGYTIDNFVAGMHRLGVDAVVANGKAETEYLERSRRELAASNGKPILSASCPAAVRFVEKNYPGLVPLLSKVPSPQQIFGETYPDGDKQSYTVSLTPCSAKKAEALRDDARGAVSQVMSPREIDRLFLRTGVDLHHLDPMPLDVADGGDSEVPVVPRAEGIVEMELDIDGAKYKTASVHGLRSVRKILNDIENNACPYRYVQLLACPKGCISVKNLLVNDGN